MNIGVLVSGSGSNLQAIIDSIEAGVIKDSCVKVVISNRREAYALERAKKHGIETVYLNGKEFGSRDEYDKKVVEILQERGIELVVLAGYLRWITPHFVESFKNRIVNIHPSLLPSFKGLHGIEQAFEYGVKVTGVTVHFVDETEDGGAVILQEPVIIEENETLETLEEKIHKVEHILYPKAIELLRSGKFTMTGRKVKIER
jgi:phosphoribosylglycinamide formyltransferase 1